MNNSPITIVGNVTQDPVLTTLPSGQSKLGFSVAVNYNYTKDGEKVEQTSFFDVEAWRWVAENSANVLEKGVGVVVVGRLNQRSWDDKETGQKRYKTEILAEDIGILTRSIESFERRKGQGSDKAAASSPAPKRTKPSAPQTPEDEPF